MATSVMKKENNQNDHPVIVSFVIINYNNSKLTVDCVASIHEQIQAIDYEIIVVDNFSKQEDYESLKQSMPDDVVLIRSKYNGGFGAGNMLGANFANGEFLLFLNNDVILTEDCVSPLCDYLRSHPEVGSITPIQYNGKGEQARSFAHPIGITHEIFKDRGLEKLFPKRYPDRYKILEPTRVDSVNGCFMLIPSDIFWRVGGFDTNIFLYCEEYDISRRIQRLGLCNIVYPGYRFTHLGGASTKENIVSNRKLKKELNISRFYVYRKYHNLFLSFIYRSIRFVKVIVNPRRWYLLPVMIRSEALSMSMKHKK